MRQRRASGAFRDATMELFVKSKELHPVVLFGQGIRSSRKLP
jgi:hypothetical protein